MGRLAVLTVAAIAAVLALFPSAAGAVVPELIVQSPEDGLAGAGPGRLSLPFGIATDPNLPGNVYVLDTGNNRVAAFDPWGEFLYTFGWGVVTSGPDNKPRNEVQKVAVSATAGSFRLAYPDPVGGNNPKPSGSIAFNADAAAVQAAIEQSSHVGAGNVAVSGPAGGPWTVEFLNDTDYRLPSVQESTLSGGTASVSLATIQDGANLETCVPAKGDTCRAGDGGSHTGQLYSPGAIATGPEGDVYVGDEDNNRIEKFSPEGEFLAAFGGDTVAHGPDDSSNDEVQRLSVAAASGSFKLLFENPYSGGEAKETAALPYNATAAEVQGALNALSTIGGLGGSVKVTGGPGDATGSAPFEIAFEGNLGGDDVPPIQLDGGGLGAAAIGGTLRCSTRTEAEAYEYRWLRNGAEIPGAESPAYTTVAADEGKSVQCQVRASSGEAGVAQAANPVYVAPPTGAPPPVAPQSEALKPIASDFLPVGGAGGQQLKCQTGTWSGATAFAYGWYRNGKRIAGATESTYVVTAKDLASPAYFQCAVTASNAGSATTTELSTKGPGGKAEPITSPPPSPLPGGETARLEVRMDPPSNVFTASEGGAPEVCKATDTCKPGLARRGAAGWLPDFLRKLATSPADGAVFLTEAENRTTGESARIQAFDADGSFRETIEVPDGANHALDNASQRLEQIATDSAGDLYAGFLNIHYEKGVLVNEVEVRELAPHGPEAEFLGFSVSLKEGFPGAMVVDSVGDLFLRSNGATYEFDPAGNCLVCGADGEGGEDGFDRGEFVVAGLAVGSACGPDSLYGAYREPATNPPLAYIKLFSPPPDATICPPPKVAPAIAAQYASAVGREEATLRAQINPNFWPDTHYHLEYGTAPCFEGGCSAAPPPPGALLTDKTLRTRVSTAPILLEGLQPGTTYHYRFVAESSGGGPVFGLAGESGAAAEATFHTYPEPGEAAPCPANEDFRSGSSAQLPDCRAYEMVSPVDKEGGEIVAGVEFTTEAPATLNQSSLNGNRVSFGSRSAFAGAESAPYTSQYVAARGEDGWRTHGISPPRERLTLVAGGPAINTELKVLSPDLCRAWSKSFAEPTLSPGAVGGYPNLYRRTDEECSGPAWEALTTVQPPNVKGGALTDLEPQGVSADGEQAIYALPDSLPGSGAAPQPASCTAEDANSCRRRVYLQSGGEGVPRNVCVLPDRVAAGQSCSAGYSNRDSGKFLESSYQGAFSADGSRVFWTAYEGIFGDGPIYLRENPAEPESARLHGAASGTGSLIGPATGTGNVVIGSTGVAGVVPSSGKFVVGQEISDVSGAIPPATTIVATEETSPGVFKLTLSAKAKKSALGTELTGLGSKTVSALATESGAFAAEQEISGPGIPFGATVVAVNEAEHKLTLSAKATTTLTAAALAATSPCTEAAKACTVAVSVEAESLAETHSSNFLAAAADGSRALFGTATFANQPYDLYEYDAESTTTQLIAHKTIGLVGTSGDATYVYLCSEEALSGANAEGRTPVVGKPNLYRYHEGEFAFVGRLGGAEDHGVKGAGLGGPLDPRPLYHAARVSEDGLHAAFVTRANPTGYDNRDLRSGKPDTEVYLYDATADGDQGRLVCASCNPSGARPTGKDFEEGPGEAWVAAKIPAWENNLYASRALSEDGSRLFFEAEDALLPRDTNGVRDVYEWEAPGAGGCEEGSSGYHQANGGCLYLISTGQSATPSEFQDASPSGDDVFFTTLSSLVGVDHDFVDLYDARVDGGLPEPPPSAAQCEGEACQGSPEAPNDPTPASESFEGAGNVHEEAVVQRPTHCPKGKVKRKGRCVKKHKHRAKHKHRKHKRRAHRHNRRAGR